MNKSENCSDNHQEQKVHSQNLERNISLKRESLKMQKKKYDIKKEKSNFIT